ncbi:MAG: tetratricopeptide repeat protein [Planctomycetota bacterium]|nr:MAG: tetratricopeptide repeat protein [Planctomycetota bacterium]REK26115.1 MAG: tetratricopeptide repeat protein [Planctomycetota bacterium]REK33485.1 MAG: tetratricopeptide repeat protein [Planctomycetota bacterium]
MDKKKHASNCYRKGVEAMEKQNWDLSVEMFLMCAKFVPDNLMYRQLLRRSEFKKYNDNGSGAGRLAKGKLLGIRSRVKKARAKEEWDDVDVACEEGLALNPWDVQLNVDLGEAAEARDYTEVAKFALQTAVEVDRNNKNLCWRLAELLENRGEYDEAAQVWQHICKLDPNDGAARSRLTGAHTKKTLDRGGYEKADSTQKVKAGKPTSDGEMAAPGESREADLKHAIRKAPENVESYLKLADYYKRTKELDKAHETLEQAMQVAGSDPSVREQLEDVELARMKQNLERANERATKDGDEKAKQNVVALSQEYHKRKLQVLVARVERYPQDLTLKFELADLHMKFKKWPQAIPLLQQAAQNQRLKARALIMLGKCFVFDKKLQLARGQLQRGVAEINPADQPSLFVDAHYHLGRICEELGDAAAAENHYGEVLVVDYDFKDARERLESLQTGSSA